MCLISTRRQQEEEEEEKNSAIGDEASRRSSVPHTHNLSLSLSLSLAVQGLLSFEKASTGMPIYKVPSSNQSRAPDLDSPVYPFHTFCSQ